MELEDLNEQERLALVALLELIIDSDAEVGDEELEVLDTISNEIGDEVYEDTADEVDRRFKSEDDLRAFLPTLKRQEARELIFGTILNAALADCVSRYEGDLLSWLAGVWDIKVETEEP